ncbi:MAG: ApbE family lipoprotein [Pelosinus sp.]|jgi:thiamine biosynthesis lipoprotein|nr:ApbE family lipoprotein [Pelosinus sp.]
MGKKISLGIVMVVALALLISGCLGNNIAAPKPFKETQFLMDTVIEITAYGPGAEEAVKAAFGEFQRLHTLTNNFDENSQLSKINQMAGKEKVAVDPTLVDIIRFSKDVSDKLGDSFDITIGPLTKLWGIGQKGEYVPTQAEIDKVLPLVNYHLVEVDTNANTVYLPKTGMMLDLGSIAKGYATDLAIEKLKAMGISSALVNAGGNVRVIGNKPDGKPWRIGIQHPRDTDGISGKLALTEWDTMETSGDYQRFIMKDGIRYSHILNPRTGWQPREVASVTMVNSSSTYGDILSKPIFVLGVEKGLELLKQFPGNEAVIVTLDGKIIITPGLEGKIELTSETSK